MAVPLFRGKPYVTRFTVSPALTIPAENATLTGINVGVKYSFITGNSVIIRGFFDSTSGFEAIVDSYDPDTGLMDLIEITNVKGFTSAVGSFLMTLAGQRGSKIFYGSADPPPDTFGRTDDIYISGVTGKVYYK